MSHVRTLEAVIHKVRVPFRPKQDLGKNLAEEIESYKRKIWECIDPEERKQYFDKKQKKTTETDIKIEHDKENSNDATSFVCSKPVEAVRVVKKPREVKNQTSATEVPHTEPVKEKTQPSLTRTDIELKVFVFKVAQLKKELKRRGKDTAGLKKDLRARLIDAMLEEAQEQQTQTIPVPNKKITASVPETIEELKDDVNETSISMEVSKVTEGENEAVTKKSSPPPSPQPKQDEKKKLAVSKEAKCEKESDKTVKETKQKRLPSIEDQKIESSSSNQVENKNSTNPMKETKQRPEEAKINPSTVKDSSEKNHEACRNVANPFPDESLKKTDISLAPINEMVANSSNGQDKCLSLNSNEKKPELLTETKMKDSSESQKELDVKEMPAPIPEVSISSKVSGTSVKDMVSKFSGFSTNPSSNNGSALSKGLQAKKEARQAKIAEMRAKAQSKPVTSTKVALSSKEYTSTLSSLNATASTGSATKKNLATQMREKAAARAFQNKITNAASKTTTSSVSNATNKRHLPLTNNSNHSNTCVSDPLATTLKQAPLIKKPPKVVMSPMDTYEMSDREDSDTDDSDSDSDNERMNKKIPTWAQRSNLYSALEEQYNGRIGGKKIDPDEIFPEVHSCDLEAIFGRRKSKNYRSRASSGNWANDQVTAAEKLVYKRQMGFATDPAMDSTGV